MRRQLLLLVLVVAGLGSCQSGSPFDEGRFSAYRSSSTLGSQLFPVPPIPLRNWAWTQDQLVLLGPFLYLREQAEESEIGHRFKLAASESQTGDGFRGGGADIVPVGADTRFTGRQVASFCWYLEAHARNLSIMRLRLWWTPEVEGFPPGWRMELHAGGSRPFGTPETVRWDLVAPPSALTVWRRLVDALIASPELGSARLTRVDIDVRENENVMVLDGELERADQLRALTDLLLGLPGVQGLGGVEAPSADAPGEFTELVVELSPDAGS